MKSLVDPLKFILYITRWVRLWRCKKEVKDVVKSERYYESDAAGLPEAYNNRNELKWLKFLDPESYAAAYDESLKEVKRINGKMEHGLR